MCEIYGWWASLSSVGGEAVPGGKRNSPARILRRRRRAQALGIRRYRRRNDHDHPGHCPRKRRRLRSFPPPPQRNSGSIRGSSVRDAPQLLVASRRVCEHVIVADSTGDRGVPPRRRSASDSGGQATGDGGHAIGQRWGAKTALRSGSSGRSEVARSRAKPDAVDRAAKPRTCRYRHIEQFIPPVLGAPRPSGA